MREVDPYIRQQSVGAGVKPRRGNSNSTTVLRVFGNEAPPDWQSAMLRILLSHSEPGPFGRV